MTRRNLFCGGFRDIWKGEGAEIWQASRTWQIEGGTTERGAAWDGPRGTDCFYCGPLRPSDGSLRRSFLSPVRPLGGGGWTNGPCLA